MKIFYFIAFLIVAIILSLITNYLYIKYDKFSDYTQIILTGLYSFLPYIPLSDTKFRFKYCFPLYFLTANIIFIPIFLTGVNDIIKSSIIIYILFLSIIFCKNKRKGAL